MNLSATNHRHSFTLLELLVVIAIISIQGTYSVSAKERIFLGPPESGTWSGSEKWLTGTYGAASTFYDFNDAAHGVCAFVLSNSVAGKENAAEWRCLPFSLGPAAGGARLITFSFAYKLSDPVAAGNNMRVLLRFCESDTSNFISERTILVGARTGDSAMSSYRTLTMNGIMAPRKARVADIWIITPDWVSGAGRFDDFSVTTEPRSFLFKAGVGMAVLLGLGTLILLLKRIWRRRTEANPVVATHHA